MNVMQKNLNLMALKNAIFYNRINELTDNFFIDFMQEFDNDKLYLIYFIDNLKDTFSNAPITIYELKNNCENILNKFYELDINNTFTDEEKELYLYYCFSNFALGKIISNPNVEFVEDLIESINNIILSNENKEDLKYQILSLKLNLLLFYNILLNNSQENYYDIIQSLIEDIRENLDFINNFRDTYLR